MKIYNLSQIVSIDFDEKDFLIRMVFTNGETKTIQYPNYVKAIEALSAIRTFRGSLTIDGREAQLIVPDYPQTSTEV